MKCIASTADEKDTAAERSDEPFQRGSLLLLQQRGGDKRLEHNPGWLNRQQLLSASEKPIVTEPIVKVNEFIFKPAAGE
ncbi:hypothetical protein N7539_005244 [Penicillium diatomitis]|uniref:Uncharacterized protein n=1 Tax=Penicillium diatomitis TaxID=2819901 RepID=A0A9W9X709_9EURO|nr:uncharacterized protein N7539_005244 [Penicillium diatomitis]KAJ5485256.1 hypothetical protein N7539_005244 [Penicillium diatomitis]